MRLTFLRLRGLDCSFFGFQGFGSGWGLWYGVWGGGFRVWGGGFRV